MGANGSTLSIDLVNGSMHHSSQRHGGGYGHSPASCTKSRTVPQGRLFFFGFFWGCGGGGEESSPFMPTCSRILWHLFSNNTDVHTTLSTTLNTERCILSIL